MKWLGLIWDEGQEHHLKTLAFVDHFSLSQNEWFSFLPFLPSYLFVWLTLLGNGAFGKVHHYHSIFSERVCGSNKLNFSHSSPMLVQPNSTYWKYITSWPNIAEIPQLFESNFGRPSWYLKRICISWPTLLEATKKACCIKRLQSSSRQRPGGALCGFCPLSVHPVNCWYVLHPKCSKIASQQKQIPHQSIWFHMAFSRLLNISTGAGALSTWFVTIRESIWETQRVSRRIAGHDSHSIINSCPHSSVKRITKSQHTLSFFFSLSLSINSSISICWSSSKFNSIFIGASPLASIKGVTLDSPTMSKVCKRLLFNPVQISVHQVSFFAPYKTVPSNSEVVVGMRTS